MKFSDSDPEMFDTHAEVPNGVKADTGDSRLLREIIRGVHKMMHPGSVGWTKSIISTDTVIISV